MIKIRLSQEKISKLKELHRKILDKPYSVEQKLDSYISEVKKGTSEFLFLSALKKTLDKLLFGEPDELKNILPKLEKLYARACKGNTSKLKVRLEEIFNYKKFSTKNRKYYTFNLHEFLNVRVCPYCNRLDTVTHKGKRGNASPQFDHWFTQEEFPYLALSLFNLIPSCDNCNVRFKKRQSFNFFEFVHPYKEGYEVDYKFSYKPKHVNECIKSIDDFSISLRNVLGISRALKFKGRNTIDAFGLDGLYNEHKSIALDILKKAHLLTPSNITAMFEIKDPVTGKRAFSSEKEYIEAAFELRLDTEELGSRALLKYRRDLHEEMGLCITI